MDYEQRYKEALDEAKAIHKAIKQDLKPVIEQIFPELSESEDDKIREALIALVKCNEKSGYTLLNNVSTSSMLAWLEKQGEQKPINKVEPKFKVGDFIVNDYCRGKVVKLTNDAYLLDTGQGMPFSYEHNIHLWTIEDAKDGDVLCIYECDEPKIVFIFKGILKKHCALSYHCYYNIMYPYFSGSEKGCLVSNNEDVKPATKEQRETLFEKMKLEGYRWDEDEKKIIRFERFVRREESDFAFKEDENEVIKFVHKES